MRPELEYIVAVFALLIIVLTTASYKIHSIMNDVDDMD